MERKICILAALIAVSLVLVPVLDVSAAGPETSPNVIFSGTLNEGGSWNIDTAHSWTFLGDEDPIKIMCAIQGNTSVQNKKTVTDYEILCNNSGSVGLAHGTYPFSHYYKIWNAEGYRTDDVDCQGSITINDVISGAFSIYVFDSFDKAIGYLQGTVDPTEALNYEYVQQEVVNSVFSADIPSPDKFYIADISADSTSVVLQYSDSVDGFSYDVKIEYLYTSSTVVEGFGLGVTGLTAKDGVLTAYSINDVGCIVCDHTVEELSTSSGVKGNELLVADKVDRLSGILKPTNVFYGSPTVYDTGFFQKFNPRLVGVQATFVPYKIVDGERVVGKTFVCRRFRSDALNELLGQSVVEISYDEDGNPYVSGQNTVDNMGNIVSGVELPEFQGYLNTLTSGEGLNGYIAVMQQFFIGIPIELWTLLGLALVVGIFLLVFRYI